MDISSSIKAAEAGDPLHQIYLARLHAMGSGVEYSPQKTIKWLRQAIEQNHPDAHAELAAYRALGFGVPRNLKKGWTDLVKAAELGSPMAQRQCAVVLEIFGHNRVAMDLMALAAQSQDLPAQILYADMLREADQDDYDYWYLQAKNSPLAQWRIASLGLDSAAMAKAPAMKSPCPETLDILDDIDPTRCGPLKREKVNDKPLIYVKRGAVPAALCRYIMAVGASHIRRSDVVDAVTGEVKVDDYRTGFYHQFVNGLCDYAVSLYDHLVAFHTDTKVVQGEPLTMLAYRPGEQYKPHWDFLFDTMEESLGRLKRSGNRNYTALVTLDDGFEGGATRFTRLDIDVKLNRGDMLVFKNLTHKGELDEDSMHAGMPVESGMKWLGSKWIRQKAYVQ